MISSPSPLVRATALVCAVEMTSLSALLHASYAPAAIALLLGCFHAGYLLAALLLRLGWDRVSGHWMIAAVIPAAVALTTLGHSWSLPFAALALLVFNTMAQVYRRLLKTSGLGDSRIKNAGKAVGMISGGVLGAFSYAPLLLLLPALWLALAATSARRDNKKYLPSAALSRGERRLLWGEFLHHAHYFAYCYTFWYLAPSLIGPWTGLWFAVGWVAYFVAERSWRERRRSFNPATMAIGHLAVAAALMAMPELAAPGVLATWFVTGIGGGTAYMLGNAGNRGNRELYEDAGHVAGTVVAGLASLTLVSHYGAAEATVTVGALLAVCTAVVFLSVLARPRYQTNSESVNRNAHSRS